MSDLIFHLYPVYLLEGQGHIPDEKQVISIGLTLREAGN